MKELARTGGVLLGIILVLLSGWIDPTVQEQVGHKLIAITFEVIGLSLILGIVVVWLEQSIHTKLRKGPKVTLITADERCDALKKAVGQYTDEDLFTTRYSSRSIGIDPKSKAYLAAIDARIWGGKANVYRIVTLDNDEKLEHVKELIKKHWSDNNFAIKVLDPKLNIPRLVDLVGVDTHFVCIGIETWIPEQNYWVRIDDAYTANHFRKYFFTTHWNGKYATEIKPLKRFDSEPKRDEAIKDLEDIYQKIHSSHDPDNST